MGCTPAAVGCSDDDAVRFLVESCFRLKEPLILGDRQARRVAKRYGLDLDVRTAEDPVLEYKVREMTFLDRVNRELPKDYEGLMVSTVTPGSWAQVANLRSGDILLAINDKPVSTIRGFKKMIREMAKEKPKRVKLFVRRGQATAFVFMRPEWPRD